MWGMGDRRALGMALVRFALFVLFGTLTSRWWMNGGWARGFRASLVSGAVLAAFLWVMDVRDHRKGSRQQP
jgi:hypothetical protein